MDLPKFVVPVDWSAIRRGIELRVVEAFDKSDAERKVSTALWNGPLRSAYSVGAAMTLEEAAVACSMQ